LLALSTQEEWLVERKKGGRHDGKTRRDRLVPLSHAAAQMRGNMLSRRGTDQGRKFKTEGGVLKGGAGDKGGLRRPDVWEGRP